MIVSNALLSYLDETKPPHVHRWRQWQIAPISGGANNLLYRATNLEDSNQDFAIKFTVRDERNRAQREYDALTAIEQSGQSIAPAAIFVDHDRFQQPVVVQQWLAGRTLSGPPQSTAEWQRLIDHYCAIHTIQPNNRPIRLAPAVLNVASGAAGKALIERELTRIPPTARRAPLQRVVAWGSAWEPPTWDPPQLTLCRVDANWRNFIQQQDRILSVDWENSGWGDPAFELADLITHPAYADVPTAQWPWLIETYAANVDNPDVIIRIQTYVTVMRLWWVVRSACYLYEVPRGLDERLVNRPADWEERAERLFARCVLLADEVMHDA